jgi:hypothetical protein
MERLTLRLSNNGRQGKRRLVGVLVMTTLVLAIGIPALAQVVRLTKIPLGKGEATITWTGNGGISPSITSVRGTAGGYQVRGAGKVPKPPSLGTSGGSLPAEVPIAQVKGAIGGSSFTLAIKLDLAGAVSPTNTGQPIGHVSGTFRGQSVTATLTPGTPSSLIRFTGLIGSLKVSGTIGNVTHHGKSSTAHATFTVSH